MSHNELETYMLSRHGLEQPLLKYLLKYYETDYSMTPLPVLLQPSILLTAIETIQHYNDSKGTEYGFNFASILSLVQIKKKKKVDAKYKQEFQLECCEEGTEYLIKILSMIEDSSDPNNKNTVMRMIEETQRKYDMEPTTKQDPKLFLIFLPMGQSIDTLQKTLMSFIKKHKLWTNYYVDYSNSNSESENGEKEFMKKVDKSMELTKQQKKKGCILLLGHQGKLGITYPNCDVTIHLDNGTNVDDAKQTYYRSLTERKGKTIGINVDLNIQRGYMYVMNSIREYKKVHNDNRSYSEILQYLFTENQFIFNPCEFGFDGCTDKMIEYFDKYEERLKEEISIDTITENIECNDDLHKLINIVHSSNGPVTVNSELNGDQQDCPKGEKTKEQVDSIESLDNTETEENDIIQVNRTKKLYECLTKLSCLLSRIDRVNPINKDKSNTDLLINLKDKKEYVIIKKKVMDEFGILEKDLNNIYDIYIDTMALENNQDVLDDIFEIYARSKPGELRKIIEKHFIPSCEQKKRNAEIPTPTKLVDEMLDMLCRYDQEYFMNTNKTFEPCCGKGNFVLAIFEKYFDGLSYIEDEIERCRTIIEECIYFCDIDDINVYITRDLLMCHALSKLGKDTWSDWNKVLTISEFKYNCYVGNTLEDYDKIINEWSIDGFNGIIGNPPYNSSGNTGTGNTLWQCFTKDALNNWLKDNGYLVYVHPPGWRKPNTERGKFYKMFSLMTEDNQMLYLSIHGLSDGHKTFHCGTRYDWYVIKKIPKYKDTCVSDEKHKEIRINMSHFKWLPNYNIEGVKNILAKDDEERCEIIQSMSSYEPRKAWMSNIYTEEYKYPCIHSTPKNGPIYKYSKRNDKGHFNVSKVIFGDSGINTPIIDIDGKYGMTQHSMAIKIDDLETGEELSKCLQSDKVKNLIDSCLYSSYAIDWNIFKDMKKDFWKGFI